jgi:hypothetical protein
MAATINMQQLRQPFATGGPYAAVGMTRTTSNSSGSGGAGPTSGPGMVTRTRSGAAVANPTLGASAGFVSFDPDQDDSELLLEGDDYDDDDAGGGHGAGGGGGGGQVEGRPRKRKSVRDLRTAAANSSSGHASGSGSGDAHSGGASGRADAGADKDDDKSRRKIQIEYIEEKSKRHITFSKRKAGIMKKVRFPGGRNSWRSNPLTTGSWAGLRALDSDGHASLAPRRVRIRLGLHLHDRQVQAARQGGRERPALAGTASHRGVFGE